MNRHMDPTNTLQSERKECIGWVVNWTVRGGMSPPNPGGGPGGGGLIKKRLFRPVTL